VNFHRDGRAELHAEANLSRRGDFEGTISPEAYEKLRQLIDGKGFEKFHGNYDARVTDEATCIVMVLRGGRAREVSEYGGVGPSGLHDIQKAIDAERDAIDWKPVK